MEAHNRQLAEWLERTINGTLMLPRFQRKQAWNHQNVERFIWAMLQGRPLGVFLVLHVDPDDPPFATKRISEHQRESRCTEHLLDGQQRLTALLSAFLDSHETHSFYLELNSESVEALKPSDVKAISRTGQYKNVIGNPAKEYANRWIPIHLLNPMRESTNSGNTPRKLGITWRKQAIDNITDQERLEVTIADLRSQIDMTTIPWLALPQSTTSSDAINIFIDTNRSAVTLSEFDIAVAQMEEATGDSLQSLVNDIEKSIPELVLLNPDEIGNFLLKAECVIQGKRPTYGNYRKLNYSTLNSAREERIKAIKWAIRETNRLKIWKSSQLPTAVPLRVLPALYKHIPEHGTKYAWAMNLVRKYLWHSFLTDRYDRQANDRLKEDYDAILNALENPTKKLRVPALLASGPTREEIKAAGWPKSRGRLSRGILAACCQDGARDIASNQELGPDGNHDYHHIFPKTVLKGMNCDADIVVNCMLLTAHTNRRTWLQKLPGDFVTAMKEDEMMQQSVPDTESAVNARLSTHLLPTEMLLRVKKETTKDIRRAYDQFVDRRARLIKARVDRLLKEGEIE